MRFSDEASPSPTRKSCFTLEDKAPPEAVASPPAFRTARARSRPAGLPQLGRKNDRRGLHSVANAHSCRIADVA